jgi:hypothetical protein
MILYPVEWGRLPGIGTGRLEEGRPVVPDGKGTNRMVGSPVVGICTLENPAYQATLSRGTTFRWPLSGKW